MQIHDQSIFVVHNEDQTKPQYNTVVLRNNRCVRGSKVLREEFGVLHVHIINHCASMGSATMLQMASSTMVLFANASAVKVSSPYKNDLSKFGSNFRGSFAARKIHSVSHNASVSSCSSNGSVSSLRAEENKRKSNLESLFCYDKAITEEIIEKPTGLSLSEKAIGNNPRCTDCQAKGVVLCATCAGSGLYVDSILESQGIIVKVRCLGCGGTGNILCTECGGRGHLGPK